MHLSPALYRILTIGLDHDVPHYQKLAQHFGGPILELGAGTGRVTLPLLQDGHPLSALDLSPAMCRELQEVKKNLPAPIADHFTIIQQDMKDFVIDGIFGLIIVPLRTIQLLSNSERVLCFQHCHQHLKEGGALAFHLGIFEREKADALWRGTWEGPCQDGWLEVDELLRYDPNRQVYQLRHRIFQSNLTGQQVASWRVSHDLANVSKIDVNKELKEAGFSKLRDESLLGKDKMCIAIK